MDFISYDAIKVNVKGRVLQVVKTYVGVCAAPLFLKIRP